MIKAFINEEYIKNISIYVSKNKVSVYMKQRLIAFF